MYLWAQKQKGFTIVELLIVIVVIAILAAITIVAYNGIQDRARSTQASSALSQSKKKLALYQIDNSAYPTTGNLLAAGISNTSNMYYQYTSDGATYCLTASTGGKSYSATNTTGPNNGACSGQAEGGTVTNLATNPRMENTTGWDNNNSATHVSTKSVGISGHPAGIPKALKSNVISTNSSSYLLSLYNVDGLGMTSLTRTLGVWLYTDAYNCEGRATNTSNWTDLSPGVWTYVKSNGGFSSWSSAYIRKKTGNADPSELGYATGSIAVEGTINFNYADGNSPNWSWNGAVNTSSSTGPAL